MILILAIGAALAGDPKFVPPMIPTPSDPGGGPSPYEAMLGGTLLDGSSSSLDLESLAHQITQFTIGADVSGLLAAEGSKKMALLRHVAADPRWRLVEHEGALVAFRRAEVKSGDATAWTVPLRGYHESPDAAWRVALRFSPWPEKATWARSPLVSRASASSSQLTLTAFHPKAHADWTAAAFSWAGPEVALEVFDAGKDESLPVVANMLAILPQYVAGVCREEAAITSRGFSPGHVPRGEPARGEPTVEILSPGPKELEIRARVHPPGAGVTWIRLLDGSLKPWEEQAVATGTREILGWSADPDELFYLQGRFPAPSGPAISGSAEVWFQAKGGGDLQRLGAFPVKVPKR